MKSRIFILLNLACLILSGTAGCGPGEITRNWTFSGVVRITGTPAVNVKLAVFFDPDGPAIDYGDENYSIVSNIVNLGMTTDTDIPFSLNLNPPDFQSTMDVTSLYLMMWEDGNGNDKFDFLEEGRFAQSQAGDPAFNTADLSENTWRLDGGHWYYEPVVNFNNGAQTGWNQRYGEKFIPVDTAATTGAKLVNSSNF